MVHVLLLSSPIDWSKSFRVLRRCFGGRWCAKGQTCGTSAGASAWSRRAARDLLVGMVAPLRPGLVGSAVRHAGGLLVGREREIAVLTNALSGGARSCVVHGATGMGKSALLSVASSIAVRSG